MNEIIKSKGYDITIGDKALHGVSQFIENARYQGPIFILADENTYKYCIPNLLKAVPDLEEAEIIQIMNGDEQKNMDVCMDIWGILVDKGATEQSLLINIGGGMICELGAFVASAYKGGIAFIDIPTTLLSMLSISVDGQATLHFGEMKNQIGFAAYPQAVFVWPEFVDTLDKRQLLSGFAEMLNYALITDELFWQKLKKVDINYTKTLANPIYQAILIKNNLFASANINHELSNKLHFGHRIANAVGYFSEYHNELPLLYGEALAIGMVCESYISCAKDLISQQQLREITTFIKSIYQPYTLTPNNDKELLIAMGYDNKNDKSALLLTLLKGIGGFSLNQEADIALIKAALSYYRKEFSNIIALN